jgi:CRP/FNR family transcriptional regulator, cyclic AMP receptor protein
MEIAMPLVPQATHIHAFLRENAFTCDLPPRVINLLATKASISSFAEGEYIFRASGPATCFYLIKAGTVCLQGHESSGTLRVWKLAEGALLGWSCLTEPYSYLLDARAETAVQLIAFPADDLRSLLSQDHELGYYLYLVLMKAAAQRIAPYADRKHIPPQNTPIRGKVS